LTNKIEELHPKVQSLCLKLIQKCKEAGIEIKITSTYRSIEEQNRLYAQGRTAPGQKCTNAKGGQSYHNYRVAFDFVPIINGEPNWNDRYFYKVGSIGESIGLEWGGRFKTILDLPHFQYRGGLTLADFRAGKSLPV
jgi:peptidoglycan L-alanyl-D-glutamate endopeptidase CwlK